MFLRRPSTQLFRKDLAGAIAIFVTSLVLVSCSPSKPAPAQQAAIQTAEELYNRQQSHISDCMAKAGFDYAPKPFLELAPASDPVTQNIMIADPEFGYGAAYLFVLGRNEGDPAEDAANNEDAYMAALIGTESENISQAGLFEPAGCTGQANTYMKQTYGEVSDRLDWSDRWRDVEVELHTNKDFQVFSERWNECMNRIGITPLSTSPIDHNYEVFFRFYNRIPPEWKVAAEGPNPITDKSSFLQAIEASRPEIQTIYDDEVAAATIDHKCRVEASVGLEPMLEGFGVALN